MQTFSSKFTAREIESLLTKAKTFMSTNNGSGIVITFHNDCKPNKTIFDYAVSQTPIINVLPVKGLYTNNSNMVFTNNITQIEEEE
jgi:hypothetical protein